MAERPRLTELTVRDMRRMNLPEEHWDKCVDHIPESVREAVHRYCRKIDTFVRRGVGLCISGGRGVGKSTTVGVIARYVRMGGYSVYFGDVYETREHIRNRELIDAHQTVNEQLREVDFLILDNLEPRDADAKFFGGAEIIALIKGRAVRHKPTVVVLSDPVGIQQASPELVAVMQDYLIEVDVVGPSLRKEHMAELSKGLGLG